MWLLVAALAHAGCDASSLTEAVTRAEQAFTEMDPDGFEAASTEADAALSCMTTPLTPVHCAGVHRVRALRAFFDEDTDATILSFQAVLATQPGYLLPEAIAPVGHPLRDGFDAARQFAVSDTFALEEPAAGWVTVDGRRTVDAPSGRPFVFQWLDGEGAVRTTAYVPLGSPVPAYSTEASSPVVAPSRGRSARRAALIGSGVALGAAAAGLYGGAFATRGAYDRAVIDGDEALIRSAYGATNGLVIAAAGAAGLGGALVVGGLL